MPMIGKATLELDDPSQAPDLAPAGPQRAAFEAALSRVCVSIPMPCAVFDPIDDTVLIANPAFLQEFGTLPLSRESFEQEFELMSVGNEAGYCRVDEMPHRGDRRVEVFHPAGGQWYAFHWSYLQDLEGCELTLLTVQNLTERMDALRQHRVLQEQLLASSRVMSVGEMATTLAHEINQPLATIVNCLTAARTLAAAGVGDAQRLRRALDLAFEQAGQAAAVVARIREFVKTRQPRRESLALADLLDHVIRLQQVDAQKHRIKIDVDLASGLPSVMVDRVMIEQVLTNLIRNGIEAMRATRPVRRTLQITVRQDHEGRVRVRVEDQGPGISADEEAQLFTPFFTTKSDGMGVGLAICRSIIEFHDGQLYFERKSDGAAFVFTLPPAASATRS